MRVPTYDAMTVQSKSGPNPLFNAGDFSNHAADQQIQLGQAAGRLGAGLAAIAADAQIEANKTVAKDLDVQALEQTNKALYDPNEGYMTKAGKNAVEGFDRAVEQLKKIKSDIISQASSDGVRRMLTPVLDERIANAMNALSVHNAKETRSYQLATSDSRAVATLQDAAFGFEDEGRFRIALAVASDEAANQGRLHGWDETTTSLKRQHYIDNGFRMRYDAWSVKDPLSAFANYSAASNEISPSVRDNIGRQLFQRAAPILADQLNKTGGGGIVSAPGGDMTIPRGQRNNNPGNLVRGSSAWEGEVQGNDPRYATFATPEAGIRAMGKTLIQYQDKYGLNTVSGIVSRWAPASENDTASYVRSVAKALGVGPDAVIDVHNVETLTKLTKSMIQVENGKQPYTDQQITAGLSAATGATPLPPSSGQPNTRDPAMQTGISLIDNLPSDWKIHVMQLAQTQARKEMAEARESLRSREADTKAEYLANGFASNPPGDADYIRAYGQDEGLRRYRDLQSVASLGQSLQQVKTLPSADLQSLIQTSKPAPGDGFAERQHNYTMLTHAVNTVIEARKEDPIAYAITNGSYSIQHIKDFSRPEVMGPELARRTAAVQRVAQDYGVPLRVFSKAEAGALSGVLRAMPVEAQKQQLGSMFRFMNDMPTFKAAMQQIAPDAPTIAVAGIYQARGLKTNQSQDVAELILRGQAILTPNKQTDGSGHAGGQSLIKMPGNDLMLSEWNSETGKAFQGKEQAADLFMQTAKAIYAARSAESGDYSGILDANRWRSAINLATGGIQSHNGEKLVMPYGLGYDQFQDRLKAQAETLAKSALSVSQVELMRLPLENIGDGRYLFRRGSGYLVDKNGRPLVADLNGGR